MAQAPHSDKKLKAFVERFHEYLRRGYKIGRPPSASAAAAKDMGLSRQMGPQMLREAEERGIPVDKNIGPEFSMSDDPVKPIEEASTIQRLEDEITGLKTRNKELLRLVNDTEDIKKTAFGLAEQKISPTFWKRTRVRDSKKETDEVPVLFTSDFQWGEVVRKEEVDGLNEFNSEIASTRYKYLIDKTIEICNLRYDKYPGLIYLRGGDAISGEIHGELADTNDLSAIPAVKHLADHEASGIQKLAEEFGKVNVISIPGNHGRTTFKPRSKGYVEFNFETMLAWWLEMFFRDDPRVNFFTPPSGDAYFKVYGWHVLLTHGDRIGSRGGQGFIGPVATITRGMKKTVDMMAKVGKPVDLMLVGHYHTPLRLEQGFANGALAGYTEYAQTIRATPHDPSQWLFYMHPDHRVTAQYELIVDRMAVPRRDSTRWFEMW